MRQIGWRWVILIALFLVEGAASAESTIDVLEKDLNDAEKQHDEASSPVVTTFLDQLEAASQSPDAALALYQQAGGIMPDPTPMANPNDDNERLDAKAARLAQDRDNLSRLANMVQLHCQMMHYAGLLTVQPDKKGLHDEWIAWLKSVTQAYSQLRGTDDLRGVPADSDANGGGQHRSHRENGEQGKPVGDWKSITMHDSIIGKFLNFHAWGDKEQGKWSVKQIPDLYRANILEPLRVSPSPQTLAAWDIYIAMKNADQTDADKWNQIDLPALFFDRACDDYAITHTIDKLQAVEQIIKANPTHPMIKALIARARALLADYRSRQPGATPDTSTASDTPTNSNVTVTKEGDMTIITTKPTNDTPANPAPPAPPAR